MYTAHSLPYRGVSVQRGSVLGSLSGESLSGRLPSPVNRQMPVKILPCHKLRLWVVINFPLVYLALKVMFSVMSVHHSVHGGGKWPLSMMHWTSLYSPPSPPAPHGHGTSLYRNPSPDMETQCTGTPNPGPAPRHGTPLYRGPSVLAASGGHHCRPVQTCSLQETPHQYWHPLAIEACTVGTSRQYASYWNAFWLINTNTDRLKLALRIFCSTFLPQKIHLRALTVGGWI